MQKQEKIGIRKSMYFGFDKEILFYYLENKTVGVCRMKVIPSKHQEKYL